MLDPPYPLYPLPCPALPCSWWVSGAPEYRTWHARRSCWKWRRPWGQVRGRSLTLNTLPYSGIGLPLPLLNTPSLHLTRPILHPSSQPASRTSVPVAAAACVVTLPAYHLCSLSLRACVPPYSACSAGVQPSSGAVGGPRQGQLHHPAAGPQDARKQPAAAQGSTQVGGGDPIPHKAYVPKALKQNPENEAT